MRNFQRAGLLAAAFLMGLGGAAIAQDAPVPEPEVETGAPAERPNFLIVLVDDAAYMDFGAFGGEARTPHIDAIAEDGAMLTNYHTSPLCAPTRAMLLTGLDNHLTGVSTIVEVIPPEHEGQPGYTLRLEPGVTTVASRLGDAGYRTYMTGKWHLGHGEGDLPADHGFQRSFILDASGADNWDEKTFMPFYDRADWFEGRERAHLPDDFYSSEFLVDQMIRYMEEDDGSDEPFFAYLALQAIHIPVQAPREFTDNYNGVYDAGWDAVRVARWERARAMGLIPDDAPLADMPEVARAWEELTPDEQAIFARSMQVNAGMLEAADHHVGRLLDYLESTGELDNTVVIITSDNGPEPNNPVADRTYRLWMHLNGYNWDIENLGEEGSIGFIGTEWALAASSPFSIFKFYTSEGGLRVPFVVSGPGIAEGLRTDAAGYVTDITPTILDLAGIDVPAEELTGRSLAGVLSGQASHAYSEDDVVAFEVSGNAAVYRGDWKLVRILRPWGDWDWHLYNIAEDPGETNDLREQHPEIFAALLTAYGDYAERVGVLEMPEGFDVIQQVRINTRARIRARYIGPVLMFGGAVIFLIAMGLMIILRRRKA